MDQQAPANYKRKSRRQNILGELGSGKAFDEVELRKCNLHLSAGLIDRLELAGTRYGIRSLSRLVELAILHYLQACALHTAQVQSIKRKAPATVSADAPAEAPAEPPTT